MEDKDTDQSHLRMIYRPAVEVSDRRQRAALNIYATLLGGSMGSRLFEEIREKRGLCYSVYAHEHSFADVTILQLGSGLESQKTVEAYGRMREIVDELRDEGPDRGGGRPRPRLRRRAARARVREHERRRPPRGSARRSSIGEEVDPEAAIAALDAVTFEEVREIAAGISDELAVACVGPQSRDDF